MVDNLRARRRPRNNEVPIDLPERADGDEAAENEGGIDDGHRGARCGKGGSTRVSMKDFYRLWMLTACSLYLHTINFRIFF